MQIKGKTRSVIWYEFYPKFMQNFLYRSARNISTAKKILSHECFDISLIQRKEFELSFLLYELCSDLRKIFDLSGKKCSENLFIECIYYVDGQEKIVNKDLYQISSEIMHAKNWRVIFNKFVATQYMREAGMKRGGVPNGMKIMAWEALKGHVGFFDVRPFLELAKLELLASCSRHFGQVPQDWHEL